MNLEQNFCSSPSALTDCKGIFLENKHTIHKADFLYIPKSNKSTIL